MQKETLIAFNLFFIFVHKIIRQDVNLRKSLSKEPLLTRYLSKIHSS